MLSRSAAREDLGIRPGDFAVLVQLGSDQSNDVVAILSSILSSLQRADNTRIVIAHSMISNQRPLPPADARISILQDYPISRFFPAFDVAISAAGYNSFHELLSFGVPTLFLPMIKETEDQGQRARYARDHDLALCADPHDTQELASGIAQLFDREIRERIATGLAALQVENGAHDTAKLLENVLAREQTSSSNHGR
jgi:UDP:flavonoid glycosyltransferase YjiC (YdhE family)